MRTASTKGAQCCRSSMTWRPVRVSRFTLRTDGEADFANGIVQLAVQAGADVIVDDISYLTEPMFQDGNIAQARRLRALQGIAYYSSAGNRARQSICSALPALGPLPAHPASSTTSIRGGASIRYRTITLTTAAVEVLSFQVGSAVRVGERRAGSHQRPTTSSSYDLDGDLIPFCDDNLEPSRVPASRHRCEPGRRSGRGWP